MNAALSILRLCAIDHNGNNCLLLNLATVTVTTSVRLEGVCHKLTPALVYSVFIDVCGRMGKGKSSVLGTTLQEYKNDLKGALQHFFSVVRKCGRLVFKATENMLGKRNAADGLEFSVG